MSIAEPDAVADEFDVARSDVELLGHFIAVKDELAFTELVRRHSGLVMGVCRRVLHNTHDIDDVFQATFLVLVRDAVRVKKQASLSSWLYGVAYRLAVRVARQKQRRRETVLVDETAIDDDALTELADRYDQQLVDQELNALPERYRGPLVLRYLAGKMPQEIAKELGITVGAVEGLLKRGKNELRMRLMQRGVTLGAALLAIQMTQAAAHAACTESLMEAAVQTGLAWNSTNPSALDPVSDRILELSGKELATMTTFTKASLAIGLTTGAMALGWGGLSYFAGDAPAGRADAGLVSALHVSRPAAARVEVASLGSDPAFPKPTEPASMPDAKVSQKSPAAGQSFWDFKRRSPNEIRIEAALESPTEVAFADSRLSEVLSHLSDFHQISIWVDQESLSDSGFQADSPINLQVREVSLTSALNLMLEPLHLDYVIKNEALVITARERSDEMMETRVYNVARIPHLTPKELIEIIVGGNGVHGSGFGGTGVTATPTASAATGNAGTPTPAVATDNKPAAALESGSAKGTGDAASLGMTGQTATRSHVYNVSLISGARWVERDGSAEGGTAWAGKTTLVILQTQRIHREIVALLDQLALEQNGAIRTDDTDKNLKRR